MRKLVLPLLLCLVALGFSACSSTPSGKYNRNPKVSYERKLRNSAFAPFMYENKFYAYYALARKIEGPDRKGMYRLEFINGPKKGEKIKTDNVILNTYESNGYDLKKGMVVLVNHFNPKVHDENSRIDTWRKGVVYSLQDLDKNIVIIEFPHDKNDFAAQKEAYALKNVRVITKPDNIRDIRNFIY